MRKPPAMDYALIVAPRRVFAWDHALGAAMATALVVVMAFVLAPAAEEALKQFDTVLPGYVVALLEVCRVIRRFGWMLAWFPAVTVGFLAGMLGSRGKRKWLVLRVWIGIGVGLGLVMGIGLYGPVLQLTMKQAGG